MKRAGNVALERQATMNAPTIGKQLEYVRALMHSSFCLYKIGECEEAIIGMVQARAAGFTLRRMVSKLPGLPAGVRKDLSDILVELGEIQKAMIATNDAADKLVLLLSLPGGYA